MQRYEIVKDYVYSQYLKIYNTAIKQHAIVHTAMVDSNAALLAIKRNQDVELAKIAALLHDYAQFVENCPHSKHAQLSAEFAQKYLSETGLFSDEEIQMVSEAIRLHSNKDQIDSKFCEIIKDADVMARFLEDPDSKMSPSKEMRWHKISTQNF